MYRPAPLVYGVLAYVVFLGVFLDAVGFTGGLATPTPFDTTPLI